jgi:hypothetical protein
MEGVAGIIRPPPTALSGERAKSRSLVFLPVEYAPLRRKGLRAVRSPSFTARFFRFTEQRPLALHDEAGRAMVMESRLP